MRDWFITSPDFVLQQGRAHERYRLHTSSNEYDRIYRSNIVLFFIMFVFSLYLFCHIMLVHSTLDGWDTQDESNRCTYVRNVTRYLDILSLLFSETLQLDRALGV